MIIHLDKDGFFDLTQVKDILEIGRVKYYKLTHNKNHTLTIKFYDSKRKLIKPYGQVKDTQQRTRLSKTRSSKSKITKQAFKKRTVKSR